MKHKSIIMLIPNSIAHELIYLVDADSSSFLSFMERIEFLAGLS